MMVKDARMRQRRSLGTFLDCLVVELGESSRIPPISEAEFIVKRISSYHCDESKDYESDYEDNLAEGQPL
jgi:hypothetical protein